MDDTTKTIVLRVPLTLGSLEVKELHLREPTAGELEIASRANTQVGTVIELIRVITKVPRKLIEQLPNRELSEASNFLGSFGEAAPTSPTQSTESDA